MRDSLGRRVGAVRGAEGVVDVELGELGELGRRARGRSPSRRARSGCSRARRTSPGAEPLGGAAHVVADHTGRQLDVGSDQLRRAAPPTGAIESSGSRPFGPPEVRDEHERRRRARAAARSSAARRGSGCRPRPPPSGERDVEVDPHEHAPVADGERRGRWPWRSVALKRRPRASPEAPSRPARRSGSSSPTRCRTRPPP